VDLDPGDSTASSVEALWRELKKNAGDNQVAVREGRRFGARLVRAPAAKDSGLALTGGESYRLETSNTLCTRCCIRDSKAVCL